MSSNPMTDTPMDGGHLPSLTQTALRKYFEAAVRFEASDLIMRGGVAPRLRLRGELKSLDGGALKAEDFEQAILSTLNPVQQERFAQHGSLDLAVDLPMGEGVLHRFRINLFRTRDRSAIAARRISNKIEDLTSLHLPDALGVLAEHTQGLVLVCGVTGSGKSTTLASLIQRICNKRACHILTIEDPIEYLFTDAKSVVNQREIGIDVPDFATGLRALVRENPDVVLIGEMRDRETFEAALQAAETGHLVFGTIHASSTSQAFGRIYDLFETDEREAIRNMLAFHMKGFLYQKLLPTIVQTPQRVPAIEVLLQSPPTRKYILEAREHELDQVIKAERELGMQSFTDSLAGLVEKELVHPQVAMNHANNPQELKMRLRGIKTE
ncbi:MAG: PilT/PilU family type 4a pilus ATPase [Phycisphaera sp.]|nr:PilT/PilU family type 4a pilus ATPase [Phycisphaera sp.]